MAFLSFRRFVQGVVCLCLGFSLVSCDSVDNLLKSDRTGHLSTQDYRDALAPRDVLDAEAGKAGPAASIPKLKPYVSHNFTQRKTFPLVSVSVNRTVPLRDVFYQLAQQADYDIELDPAIRGSVIFSARQRPFDQVIQRLCSMAGLRYTLRDQVLRVEIDRPYNKVYRLDYLSFVRESSSSIDTSVSVVAGEGADTGSSFSSSFESSSNFWEDLEDNLTRLLSSRQSRFLVTDNTPVVSGLQASGQGGADALVSIGAIDSGASSHDREIADANFLVNRQAGLISIYAPQVLHKEVKSFLDDLKRSVTAQVLIEAKVLEVALSDSFASGVDWSLLNGGEFGLSYLTDTALANLGNLTETNPADSDSKFSRSAPSGESGAISSFVASYEGNDFSGLIRAISRFGTTKALASPRLVVLNNQSAVLNVATNRVFFIVNDTEIEESEGAGGQVLETTTFDFETKTIPEGVIINVMPSINLDEGKIALAVRPSVTRVTNQVVNPFLEIRNSVNGTKADGGVPEVSVQEIDTVLSVNSGEAVVIGGLMRDTVQSTEDGIPLLSDIPVLGAAFKSHGDRIRKTELVIFLQATILDQASKTVHDTDRDLYRKFSDDRRPFKF